MDAALDTARRTESIDQLIVEATSVLCAAGVGTARLDAELLLAAACGLNRTALYTSASAPVSAQCAETLRAFLARRQRREPLQYILGRQEFWSLDFTVTPDVLIPRPETELLVEVARRLGSGKGLRLCDIGTGSGCIAVALAHELPSAEVWALDVSASALAVAETNARRYGVAARVRFLRSDLFAAVARQRFDVIVSNPPYLTAEDLSALQPEVACEPRSALDGGADGLDVIRRLLAVAPDHLVDGGCLLMELGATQAVAVEDLTRTAGFRDVSIRSDYAGLPRVLIARC